MMVTMPISQESTQELEHQELPRPLSERSQAQLRRVLGQLQTLLTQREALLKLRTSMTVLPPEAPPEQHRERLLHQRKERGRQQQMQKLSDKLCELGERLPRALPSQIQGEPSPRLSDVADDQRQLQELKIRSQEVSRREGRQQEREEEMERNYAQDVLSGLAGEQSPTPVQQRMQRGIQRVEHVTDGARQLEEARIRRLRTPAPGVPVRSASEAPHDHQQLQDSSVQPAHESTEQEIRARYARSQSLVTAGRPTPSAPGDTTSGTSPMASLAASQAKKKRRSL